MHSVLHVVRNDNFDSTIVQTLNAEEEMSLPLFSGSQERKSWLTWHGYGGVDGTFPNIIFQNSHALDLEVLITY